MSDFDDCELMDLLKGVSRSFVLTIRALPCGLRRPVGLAYLLARATDTMADTASAPVHLRLDSLRAFPSMLAGGGIPASLAGILPGNEAEQRLLRDLPRVTAVVRQLPPGDQSLITVLLEKITRGQELDLMRFPDPAVIRALGTAAELDEYTYLVAGCVGEFWTAICAAHIRRYARLPLDELTVLGRAFGQGLQLVNILRDMPEDFRNGRCYLPLDELRRAGIVDLAALCAEPGLAAPVFQAWRSKALLLHEDACRYIEAIRPWRVRFACLLPWALGVKTLRLMGTQSPLTSDTRIKAGRADVTRVMRRAAWAAFSNRAIGRVAD